jgi:hypothetical protein
MDNRLENEIVKATLNTQGWFIIESWLKEKVTEVRLARNTKKDKRFEDIAIDVLARQKAANRMLSVLNKLDRIKNGTEVKKQVYR